jgi:hypothetical protein
MNDGEQEPEPASRLMTSEAADEALRKASPDNKEAAWLELWHARDFTWRGKSEKASCRPRWWKCPPHSRMAGKPRASSKQFP